MDREVGAIWWWRGWIPPFRRSRVSARLSPLLCVFHLLRCVCLLVCLPCCFVCVSPSKICVYTLEPRSPTQRYDTARGRFRGCRTCGGVDHSVEAQRLAQGAVGGGGEHGVGVGQLDGGGDVGDMVGEEGFGGGAACAVAGVVGGALEPGLNRVLYVRTPVTNTALRHSSCYGITTRGHRYSATTLLLPIQAQGILGEAV